MPSVAQQDYIKIECLDRPFFVDAESLKKLKKAINRGTIFDVIIRGIFRPGSTAIGQSRILACQESERDLMGGLLANIVYFSSQVDFSKPSLESIPYTEENYDFLEYVQKECDTLFGSPYQYMPYLSRYTIDDKEILCMQPEGEGNIMFSTEDGFAYEIEVDDDDIIIAVKKSSITEERAKEETGSDYIMILPEEKAAEMVGLMAE